MAFVVDKTKNQSTFDYITRRNLLWQIEYLQESINFSMSIGSSNALALTCEFIESLNHFAVVNLVDKPGKLRDGDVHIRGSDYVPPRHWEVHGHVQDLVVETNREWRSRDPFELSAYVLWRLNWIHPFFEGNGRTARAASYYVLCRRYEILLPGRNTIIGQLSGNREYYSGLKHADKNITDGKPDLGPLTRLLEDCFEVQMRSAGAAP